MGGSEQGLGNEGAQNVPNLSLLHSLGQPLAPHLDLQQHLQSNLHQDRPPPQEGTGPRLHGQVHPRQVQPLTQATCSEAGDGKGGGKAGPNLPGAQENFATGQEDQQP